MASPVAREGEVAATDHWMETTTVILDHECAVLRRDDANMNRSLKIAPETVTKILALKRLALNDCFRRDGRPRGSVIDNDHRDVFLFVSFSFVFFAAGSVTEQRLLPPEVSQCQRIHRRNIEKGFLA